MDRFLKKKHDIEESNSGEEEELAAISTDCGLMMIKHKELSLEAFWISIKEEYVATSKKALNILLQFSTSYFELCAEEYRLLFLEGSQRSQLASLVAVAYFGVEDERKDHENICKAWRGGRWERRKWTHHRAFGSSTALMTHNVVL
ncbi:protein FAM200A-like [Saccopteryx bilineata]|uniref:protein FAM200A-like n=1 Tax=Saccopteryx bilineata TaxID=59482 RepID=UPI00338D5FD0